MSESANNTTPQFNHQSEASMQNPWPTYEKFRKGGCPINHTSELGGYWTVATYDAIKEVEFDWATYTSSTGTALPVHPSTPMYPIDMDPPEHASYRNVLNKHFTPDAANKWRDTAITNTHALIDKFIERGEADLASELCRPLLPEIILPMLGVPPESRADLAEWIDTMTKMRVANPPLVYQSMLNIEDCLKKLSAKRRTMSPQGDLIDALLTAKVNGELLDDDQIYRTLIIILFGGLDTTTAVMLNTLKHFSECPEDAQRFLNEPSLRTAAIEEFVRYASPIQGLRREVTKDTVLQGQPLKAGDAMFLLFASANRDETKFADADRCIIDRPANQHMGFGIGPHLCLGRNFARMELDVLLPIVLERLPDYKVKADFVPEYTGGEARALKSLPVTFTPGSKL